ncbi:MAG: ATP-binding protein [Caulobacteraceae bacterium]
MTTKALRLSEDATRQDLVPGDYVMLSISDEGIGMLPHIAARATEPFFTTKGLGAGTGLGLAMAQGFAQQSGGRLEIATAPDRGTTVRMIFPEFTNKKDEAGAPTMPTSHQARPIDQSAAPPLILVVDENQELAALAQEALREVGYRVVVAHSAEDALMRFDESLAAGDRFKLVFF